MRRRRALIVRIAAGVGVALALTTQPVPTASLKAQNPGEPEAKKGDVPPLPDAPSELPTASPIAETEPVPTPVNPLPPATPVRPSPSSPLPLPAYTREGNLADPEAAAQGFVEKSTKEADDAIKALSKESETLRARLQKVEAGLARWQAVKAALAANGPARGRTSRVVPGSVVPPPVEVSTDLPPTARSPFDIDRPAAPPSDKPLILDPLPPRPGTAPATPPEIPPPASESTKPNET